MLVCIAGIAGGSSSIALIALISSQLATVPYSGSAVAWLFAGLCVAVAVSKVVCQAMSVQLGQALVADMRLNLCNRILQSRLDRIERIGNSGVLAVLTGDVPVVANSLTSIPLVGVNLAIVLAAAVYLAYLSWQVLLGVLVFLVISVSVYVAIAVWATGHFRRAREEYGVVYGHLVSLIQGVKELKLNRAWRIRFVDNHLRGAHDSYASHDTAARLGFLGAANIGQLLFFVLIGILLFAGPYLWRVERDVLTGYVLVIIFAIEPISTILVLYPGIGQGAAALKKIEEFSSNLHTTTDPAISASPPHNWEGIELAAVSYRYPGDDRGFTLGPVDFTLRPGELVFILGGNGSGKTSLGKIITGLYPPDKGTLRWDGRMVDDTNRESYRQLFSAVFADFHVFDEQIAGYLGRHPARARAYFERLRLPRTFYASKPYPNATRSTGERTRLALLVAYAEDRSIFLLDEWAANQDPETKRYFYCELLPELRSRGKCVVVMTHDDAYFHIADRTFKLVDGLFVDPSVAPGVVPIVDQRDLIGKQERNKGPLQ